MIKLTLKTQSAEEDVKSYNYEFDQPVVTLGRLKENDIQLPESTVSGFHAQILKEEDNYYLVDRGSINGTFLNNQRLLAGEKKLLQDGDTIRIQSFELYFTSGVAAIPVDQGATIQVARQMVMELLGSWESQQEPRVIVMGGPHNGKQLELTEGKKVIAGRAAQCDIVIEHPTISRKHAEISFSWNGAFVKDLGSANGVYVNDVRIEGTYKLRDRDEIRLGQQNSNDAVRLVFSNPAEALLSKIEEAQITDGTPGAAQQIHITSERPIPADAVPPPPPLPTEQPPAEGVAVAVPPPITEAPPISSASPVAETPPPKKQGMSAMMMGLLIGGAFVLLFSIVAIGLLFYTGKHTVLEQRTQPEKGTAGDIVQIKNEDLDASKVRSASLLGRDAPIVESSDHTVHVKIPLFPNLPAGTKEAEIQLTGAEGMIARSPFTLITLPQIKGIEPSSARSGSAVDVLTDGDAQELEIYFGSQKAPVVSRNRNQLRVHVPVVTENVPDAGLKMPVTLALQGTRSKQAKEFTVLPGMRIRAVTPNSATPGAEVRIQVDEIPSGVGVFFGKAEAPVKAKSSNEIIVTVPPPPTNVPQGGMIVPLELRVNNVAIAPKTDFTIVPESLEMFQLSFFARPYPDPLGFNEYAVATNIGPFLVVVAKDEYGSSKTRAEVIAANLTDKIPFFRQNLSAKITMEKIEGVYSIFADSDVLQNRELLLHVFPDDALAYSKITQRPVGVDALAEWWKMLIDSYFKVFIQVQSPANTGILGAGGSVLQQIFNFYSLKTGQGQKYYKKDLMDTLPADQKTRLVALSMNPPKKLMSVDGKWGGRMSNILYSNISDQDLELVVTLRQNSDGNINGIAEVNWKVGMGRNEGGFENVAYKKLGSFGLSGMFRKSQAYPVEFSFVEKDGRRLQFVGKLEGEALVGSFVISSTGQEGTWSLRLRS
jgi:pSer/pThr/pTyr-binding forkhead associated (FHA) protein